LLQPSSTRDGSLRDRTDLAIRGGFSLGCACVCLGYGKRVIDRQKLMINKATQKHQINVKQRNSSKSSKI